MATLENIVIREVAFEESEILQQIFDLRVTCRKGSEHITIQKYPNGWSDEMDFYSIHFAAFHYNELIASGRITLLKNIEEHPYYPAIEHIIGDKLKNTPVAYLSRDQVSYEYRGMGLRTALLDEREKLCKTKFISHLFIDVAEFGSQLSNFERDGYRQIGHFDTSKIYWELGDSILMHKRI